MENSFEEKQKLERARRKVKSIKGFYKHFAAYLFVNISLLIIRLINLGPEEDFFEWGTFTTAIIWGVGLLIHGLGVFGPNVFFGKDWEERKIKEIMDRNRNSGKRWE